MSGTSRDHGAYTAKLVAYQAQRREVREDTKAVLFKTLAAASIATVIVTSGGSGDAGQIRDVSVYDGTGPDTALPDVDFGILATVTEACSLREVIGSMATTCPSGSTRGERTATAFTAGPPSPWSAEGSRVHCPTARCPRNRPVQGDLGRLRPRALRHHAEDIAMVETVFGATLTTRQVPVRLIDGQHVRERLGRIPSLAD